MVRKEKAKATPKGEKLVKKATPIPQEVIEEQAQEEPEVEESVKEVLLVSAVKPLWQKKTRGTLILRAPKYLRIKPNQQLRCTKEELGRFWNTDFDLIQNGTGEYAVGKIEAEEPEIHPPTETFSINPLGDEQYNVLSQTGKIMNEAPLSLTGAEKLKKELEKAEAEQE